MDTDSDKNQEIMGKNGKGKKEIDSNKSNNLPLLQCEK
jgi:hypothetical protein